MCVTASHSLWFIDLDPDSWTTVKKTVDYIWWSAKTNQTCPPSVLLSILVLNVVGSRRSLLLLQLTRMSSLRRSRVLYPGRRFLYIATWPLLQRKHINGLKKQKTNGFDCSIVKIAMIACISTWVFSKLFHSEISTVRALASKKTIVVTFDTVKLSPIYVVYLHVYVQTVFYIAAWDLNYYM